jgi:hypothetical protein
MSSDWTLPGRRSPQPYGGGTDLHGWCRISHWLCSDTYHDDWIGDARCVTLHTRD